MKENNNFNFKTGELIRLSEENFYHFKIRLDSRWRSSIKEAYPHGIILKKEEEEYKKIIYDTLYKCNRGIFEKDIKYTILWLDTNQRTIEFQSCFGHNKIISLNK